MAKYLGRETPTKTGWYWRKHGSHAEVVGIVCDNVFTTPAVARRLDTGDVQLLDATTLPGEWWGPLTPPWDDA